LGCRFFVEVYITTGCFDICLHLNDVNILWGFNNRADLRTQSFIGFKWILDYNASLQRVWLTL